MDDLHHTACHEAGHVVLASVFRFPLGPVTIVADADSAGHHIVADKWVILQHWWDNANRWHLCEDNAVRARIMVLMAGRAAELECCSSCNGGEADDDYWIGVMVDSLVTDDEERDRWLTRLRQKTAMLVQRHRPAIERITEALKRRSVLSASEIASLLGF